MGDPPVMQTAWGSQFCSFPSDIGPLELCGGLSNGDPEAGSLLFKADSGKLSVSRRWPAQLRMPSHLLSSALSRPAQRNLRFGSGS